MKKINAAALILLGVLSAGARTTETTVPVRGGSAAALPLSSLSWSNDLPIEGDTVVIRNTRGVPATLINDCAYPLAAIVVEGSSPVTFTGLPLTLTGDGSIGVSPGGVLYSCAISNTVPLTLDVPVTVASPSVFRYLGDLTFNKDVTVVDEAVLCLYRTMADAAGAALTFNGHLIASNATVDACLYSYYDVTQGNTYPSDYVYFNKSIDVDGCISSIGSNNCNFVFNASGNVFNGMVFGGNQSRKIYNADNVFSTDRVLDFGTVAGGWRPGEIEFNGDQTVAGIESADAGAGAYRIGARVLSDAEYPTLYIRSDSSHYACCTFGDNDGKHGKFNVDFAATGENAADVVQTFASRHQQGMTGKLTVRSGKVRLYKKAAFLKLPEISVLGGTLEVDRSAGYTPTEFPMLERLYIGSTGRFRVTSENNNSNSPFSAVKVMIAIDQGGKIELGAGISATAKWVVYNGSPVVSGTYTKANADWIDGDGEVQVNTPSDLVFWQYEADGVWSDVTKWSNGYGPQSGDTAVLIASKSDYTVNLGDPSLLGYSFPSQIQTFGFGGKKVTIVANAADAMLSGFKLDAYEGSSFSVPENSSVYLNDSPKLNFYNGSEFVVEGDFVARVLEMNLYSKMLVTGSLVVTNETDNKIVLREGCDILVSNALFQIGRNVNNAYATMCYDKNSSTLPRDMKFRVVGDSRVELNPEGGAGHARLDNTGREFSVGGNSVLSPDGISLGNLRAGTTNVMSITDNATIDLKISSPVKVGLDGYGTAWSVLNLASSNVTTTVNYGCVIGRQASGCINILNGHTLKLGSSGYASPGDNLAMNQRRTGYPIGKGVMNVVDGELISTGSGQGEHDLCGFQVGTWPGKELTIQTERVEGELNVHRQGRVSAADSNKMTTHLFVGGGRYAYGEVNVYGGTIDFRSLFNPMIGFWGGEGVFNVKDNGNVYIKNSAYFGGADTSELFSFQVGNNGGANFGKYYDVTNMTGRGTLNVESGKFVVGKGDAVFSQSGTGILKIGAEGLLAASNIVLASSAPAGGSATNYTEVVFTFGRNGCGKAVCGTTDENGEITAIDGKLTIAPGTSLTIDASDLVKFNREYYPIIQFSDLEGDFENIRVITPIASPDRQMRVICDGLDGVGGYYLQVARDPAPGLIIYMR